MILYLVVIIIILAAAICIRTFCLPETLKESHIPSSLTKKDLYMDGNRLLYYYEGKWYEAISKHDDIVYIYDVSTDKIVRVPYIKGE